MAASRRVATLAVLLTIAAGIVLAQPAQAVWPGGNGKIVFYKVDRVSATPSAQIFSMNSQGGGQTNLSAAGGGASQLDIQPSVSPNGKRIAFTRADPSNNFAGQIWTMKIDGSDQTNTSNDAAAFSEAGPAWSEDGSKILFVRQQAGHPVLGGFGAIWIRPANGHGTARQLTPGPPTTFDANPAMSPDGDLIVLTRIENGAPHLIVMKADGSEAPRDLGQGAKPDWSPDSSHLAYGQGGSGPIMVVQVSDPSNKHTLTGFGDEAPVWSPDGTQIVFMDCTGPFPSPCQIALMSATGQNQHDITTEPFLSDTKPDWQRVQRDEDARQT